MEIKDLVGKRCLIKHDDDRMSVIEVLIAEMSPSGGYIKIQSHKHAKGRWIKISEIEVIDVLTDTE